MLGQVSDFQVLPSFGSDHFPLLLEISQSFSLNDEIITEYESFYELRSQNLHMIQKFPQTFKKDVDHFVSTMIPQPFTLDVNELWSKLQGAIYQGLKKNHLLRPKCKKRKFNSMMLSDELLQLRQENRNVFRRKIQIMRKEKWHKFVSSIDADEDRSSIWRKFRIPSSSGADTVVASAGFENSILRYFKRDVPAYAETLCRADPRYSVDYSHDTELRDLHEKMENSTICSIHRSRLWVWESIADIHIEEALKIQRQAQTRALQLNLETLKNGLLKQFNDIFEMERMAHLQAVSTLLQVQARSASKPNKSDSSPSAKFTFWNRITFFDSRL
jgi:hypothetical protein